MDRAARVELMLRAAAAGWAIDDGEICSVCGKECAWIDPERRRVHPWCAPELLPPNRASVRSGAEDSAAL